MRHFRKWALVISGLLIAGSSEAATYWVNPSALGQHCIDSATDPRASSSSQTIAQGLACLASGDTLFIRSGTYNEAIDYNQIPTGGGTWSTATRVLAATGNSVILQPVSGAYEGSAVIAGYDQSYIIFGGEDDADYGMKIDASNISNMGIRIIDNAGLPHHIRVQNTEIYGSPNSCTGDAKSSFNEWIHNQIHNCGTSSFESPLTGGHGIYVAGSENDLVEGNEVYEVGGTSGAFPTGYGIHVYHPGSNNNIIRNNYVHDNVYGGIIISSGDNNVAYNNIIVGNPIYGLQIGTGTTTNNKAYHNTIYDNASCIDITSGIGAVVRNNLCLANAVNTVQDFGSGSTIDHNYSTTDPAGTVVDAAGGDFRLVAGSGAIDQGIALDSRYNVDY